MRVGWIVVAVGVGLGLGLACERAPSTSSPPDAAPAPSGPPGSQTLKGSWRAEGFLGSNPAGSVSAAVLNAALQADAGPALTIAYTGDQVKMRMPNGQLLTSSYVVLEERPGFVRIQNGPDRVDITFSDADHMIVDRPNSAYFTKMKLRRVGDAGT